MQEKVLKGSKSEFQQLGKNTDVDNSSRLFDFHLEKAMVHRKNSLLMPHPLHSRLFSAIS